MRVRHLAVAAAMMFAAGEVVVLPAAAQATGSFKATVVSSQQFGNVIVIRKGEQAVISSGLRVQPDGSVQATSTPIGNSPVQPTTYTVRRESGEVATVMSETRFESGQCVEVSGPKETVARSNIPFGRVTVSAAFGCALVPLR